MNVITKDILTVERGIIGHQVNCLGIMGGGLAFQIAQKWPHIEEEYRAYCGLMNRLGEMQLLIAAPGLWIANLFGQDNIGRGVQTDYRALSMALFKLSKYSLPVYLPYQLGCGLAGGSWQEVSSIIEQTIPSATICKLP